MCSREMERMQAMETNKYGAGGSIVRETDGEKLGGVSEYNQFSYEPSSQQPTSIVFPSEGKAGNEALARCGSI